VAVGGAHALIEFHLSGAHAANPPPMLATDLRSRHGYPTLSFRSHMPLSRALRPVTTGNALPAMSYRNCWHIFSPGLSKQRNILQLLSLTCVYHVWRVNACSDFRPVTKIPHCCLWRGSFKPQVAGRPQSPARDRWLGYPTPNPVRAHPPAAEAFIAYTGVTGTGGQHLASYSPIGRKHPEQRMLAKLACVRRHARIRPEP